MPGRDYHGRKDSNKRCLSCRGRGSVYFRSGGCEERESFIELEEVRIGKLG